MSGIPSSSVTFEDFKKIVYDPPSYEYEIIFNDKGLEAVPFTKNPTEERSAQRTAAWEVFVSIVEKNLSSERLDFIKKRYHLATVWQEWNKKTVPLVAQVVEKIGVGAANVYTSDLKEILRQETGREKVKLSLCQEAELKQLYDRADPFKFIRNVANKLEITGGPQKPGDYVTHDSFEDDRVRLTLSQDFENLKERVEEAARKNPKLGNSAPHFFELVYQRLAMAIVTCETADVKEGEKLCKAIIPVPRLDGQRGLDYYKVHRIVIGRGLYAVALKPILFTSLLPPLLMFRPTVPAVQHINAPDTVIEDLNPEIGRLGYEAAKSQLDELMKDPKFLGLSKGIVTLAYSLGGAFNGYFLRDHWKQVSSTFCFNTVSNASKKRLDYVRAVLHGLSNFWIEYILNDKTWIRHFVDSYFHFGFKNKTDNPSPESNDGSHVVESLAAQINQLSPDEHGPSFFIKRVITDPDELKGDAVTFNGEKHPGWGITHPNTVVQVQNYLVDLETPKNYSDPQLIRVHAFRFLEPEALVHHVQDVYTYRHPALLEKHLDNRKRRFEFEELRRTAGEILHPILNNGYLILGFLFRFFNFPILRAHHKVSHDRRNRPDA